MNEIEEWLPSYFEAETEIISDTNQPAVYMMQYVTGPRGESLLLFYDSGCYGACISNRTYAILETKTVRPGPTPMDVASGYSIMIEYGDEKMHIELEPENGKRRVAAVTALRMKEVSTSFPVWPLTEAYGEIKRQYEAAGYDSVQLPTVEKSIGGKPVDIMLGVRYNRLFPTPVFFLPSGLGIYKSVIKGKDGHNGVLGGPHDSWVAAMKAAHTMGPAVFFTSELRAYRSQSMSLFNTVGAVAEKCEEPWFDLAGDAAEDTDQTAVTSLLAAASVPGQVREMLRLESIGADVDYRCAKCRTCVQCKNADKLEKASLVEEREQYVIEQALEYDKETKQVSAALPFILEPSKHISDNYFVAKKVLESQLRIAAKTPEIIPQVIASHNKLRDKGFVMKLNELPESERKMAAESGYYLPWRPVHSGSLSTPCRMVFDASARCSTGFSLNCTLAKGQNMLATLYHLLIQFRLGGAAMTADVSMAYNAVRLRPEFFRFQKYLWVEDLVIGSAIIIMVILTLIYGVKSSGNLTIGAFQIVAEEAEKDENLKKSGGPRCLKKKMYLDDCLAAFNNNNQRDTAGQGLVDTLALGSMNIKALTKSGEPPSEKVSADGEHVSVVGYLWHTVRDELKLDIKPLYLDKVKRGRIPKLTGSDVKAELAAKFTRRVLCSKVAAVFDPLGIATPVTARLKTDLSVVVKKTTGWDDFVDVKLLDLWVKNLADIQKLKEVAVPRSILTVDDEESVPVDLIVATDASQLVAAAAVYARVQHTNGQVECMLITAKSKLVNALTIPRAELRACTIGACLAAVVSKNFGGRVRRTIYVTDSAVALNWMSQDQRPLQVGVRNQVIQIRRFSNPEDWWHVVSADNPADLASRGAEVSEILQGSEWQCGKSWMRKQFHEMPLRNVEEVSLTDKEKVAAKAEIRNSDLQGIVLVNKVADISDRYMLSRYLIDPCSVPWDKFVRKMAVLKRIVRIWRSKDDKFATVGGKIAVILSDSDVEAAKQVIFTLTTAEVKKFNKPEKYADSTMLDGILKFNGRILDDTKIDNPAGVMFDLEPLTFSTPMIDRFSPVAYSTMIYSHVKLTHHGGARSTYRASLELVHVIGGQNLASEVVKDCHYCQRYKVKLTEAVMSKQHKSRMTIAPAFYAVQADLFGPLQAFCKHGRRSVLKVWGLVFKCPTTLAVAAYIMDEYSTGSFLDAFFRFTARYGMPATLYIDGGSQLVSACNNATFSISDITKSLNENYDIKINFEVCPVGGHNMHGAVERQIREVRRIMHTVCKGIKLDVLQWETTLAWISNEINSMPLSLGNRYVDLDNLDLITPSRLLLGRNNKRAVAGLAATPDFAGLLGEMEEIERAWWMVWKDEKLADLVPQPKKWRAGDPDVREGDVVVFVRDQSELGGPSWRVGMVHEVERSADNVIRKVTVKYKNASESTFRYTHRAVRAVAVIWRESDLDLAGELSAAQRRANIMLCRSTK